MWSMEFWLVRDLEQKMYFSRITFLVLNSLWLYRGGKLVTMHISLLFHEKLIGLLF